MVDADYLPRAIEEHHIDGESHEHHVHAHERLEPAGVEEHPGIRVEPVPTEQAPALTCHPACLLEGSAEHGRAGLIEGAQPNRLFRFDAVHFVFPNPSSPSCSPALPAILSRTALMYYNCCRS